MVKQLTKGIEESKKGKERIIEGKEKLHGMLKEIEQKAFMVQENYKKMQKVDAEFKFLDMKKMYKELDTKEKGYKKRLDDLEIALQKHMEQIQKDLVDTEKLQATLADETLTEASDLKRALEMVALLEAQLKEMNPNLDSI